jgi:membrane-bound lytic murein transglycosylase D
MRLMMAVTTACTLLCAVVAETATAASQDSIWPRLVSNMRLVNDEQREIINWARHYARHPDATERMLARSQPFLWHIVEAVDRYELPAEVALLPAIESGFDPHAASPQQAHGLWQFLPSTGRALGLTSSPHYDARRDPVASTDAALRYLRSLYSRFGDWQLALAAYNIGAARLSRLVAAQPRGTDFWALELPRETYEHVRRLMAMALLVEQPQRFGLKLPAIPNRPAAEPVALERPVNLVHTARAAGVPEAVIRVYNPGLQNLANTTSKTTVLLPTAHAARLRTVLAETSYKPEPIGLAVVHIVQAGESLWRIARRYDTSVDALLRHNKVLRANLIRPGSRLEVPAQTSS